jgi:parallel beta-helix repeat protein
MKNSMILFFVFFTLNVISVFGQVEVKGKGNTSVTKTFFTSNSKPDTTMVILDDGKVGIGTTIPSEKLEVKGVIFSSAGGVKFPDGTTQLTAFTSTGVAYQNVFTVSPSGGDFPTITAALGACVSPSPTNTYLIRVMPGIYNENVNSMPYVHLKGVGKYTAIIQGMVTGSDFSVIEGFKINEGVVCIATSPTIIHNIITAGGDLNADGIQISNDASPWIIENEIVSCKGSGIYCKDIGSSPWIIGNKIIDDSAGGIKCEKSSPIISNNTILNNAMFGISVTGQESFTAKPVIDDNLISSVGISNGGSGIYLKDYVIARVTGNVISNCEYGIFIESNVEGTIISNIIHENFENGIYCNTKGITQRFVIRGNHIYKNGNPMSVSPAGILIQGNSNPIISHNTIYNNFYSSNPATGGDINYFNYLATTPGLSISLNVFDNIVKNSAAVATGLYNVTTTGGSITP